MVAYLNGISGASHGVLRTAAQAADAQAGFPGWLLILILLLAVIVVLWMWWSNQRQAPVAPPPAAPVVAPAPEVMPAPAPPAPEPIAEPAALEHIPGVESTPMPTPVQTKPDDLKVIEGIGPKTATLLNGIGITTHAQLAASDVEVLREILRAVGYSMIDPATWPEQAQLAADGQWDKLKALQDSLKGSRRA